MPNFNCLTMIEGIKTQVNYDNINFIVPSDYGSLITFRDGETLMVKEKVNLAWPSSDDALFASCAAPSDNPRRRQ